MELSKKVISVFLAMIMILLSAPIASYSGIRGSFIQAEAASVSKPKKVTNIHACEGRTSAWIIWSRSGDATKYQVAKYNPKTKKYSKVATVTDRMYFAENLKANTRHTYAVRAVKVVGKKSYYGDYVLVEFSTRKSVSRVCGTRVKSAKPTSAVILWHPVADKTGYLIYSYNLNTKKLTKVGKTAKETYTLKNLKSGKNYYYKVRAYRTEKGKTVYGALSDLLKVTTPGVISATSVVLAKGDSKTVTLKGAKVKSYKSSNQAVAKVNSKGLIKAAGKGKTYVTVKDTNGLTYKVKIKVETPVISSKKTVSEGSKTTLKLSGNTQKIKWSTSDKSIASVNSKGVVTAKKAGTVKITAKVSSGAKFTCTVKIKHVVVTNAAKAATCTETGLTEGKVCSVCGKVFAEQKATEALGHNYEVVDGSAVEATCTEAGKKVDMKCTRCGDVITGETIAAHGHTEEITPAVAATCTEKGLTEGKKCSRCGEILLAQEETAALGHNYEAVDGTAANATCTEAGKKADMKCTRCGDVVTGETIAALGHDEVTSEKKSATYVKDGFTEEVKCSRCNEILKKSEKIESKLAVACKDFNAWAKENEIDNLVKAEIVDNNITVTVITDGVWSFNTTSTFDGLFTLIGKYLKENFNGTVVSLDGFKVYDNGTVNNTMLKKIFFTVGNGMFYKIANLPADGTYGRYNVVIGDKEIADEDVKLNVVIGGTDEKIEKIKSFAKTIADHVSADISGEDLVIDIELPDAMKGYMADIAADNDTSAKELLAGRTVGDCFGLLGSTSVSDIFGSQNTAVNKLAETLCKAAPVVNKGLAKMTATVTLANGQKVTLLENARFAPEKNNYNGFVSAVTEAMDKAVKATKISDYTFENGVYTVPVNIEFDASNLGVMSGNLIKETVVINIHAFDKCNHENYADVFSGCNKICSLCGEVI